MLAIARQRGSKGCVLGRARIFVMEIPRDRRGEEQWMRYELRSAKARVMGFGLMSALLVAIVMTSQIVMAATDPPPPPPLPSDALNGDGTDIPVTPLPPGVTPAIEPGEAVSAPYTWFESTVVNAGTDASLFVPARAMTVGGEPASGHFIVRPLAADQAPPAGPENVPDRPTLVFSGRSVEVEAYGHTAVSEPGYITDQARFTSSPAITLGITDEEWEAAAGDITYFEVRYYDDGPQRWVKLPGAVDPFSPRSITATVPRLATFGLFLEQVEPLDGGDVMLGTNGIALAGLFGLALVAVGFYVRRRATSRA